MIDEDRPSVIAAIDSKSAGNLDPPEFPEYRIRRPDGSVRWILARAYPVRDPTGRTVRIAGTAEDITERKQAEQKLRESEQRHRAILETAVDGIIVVDQRGTVESANKAAERLFGYAPGDLIGRNVSVLMPEPFKSEHHAYLANYLNTGTPKIMGFDRDLMGRRKDGTTFPICLAVGELTLGNRRMFTGIVHDITERKQAESALQTAHDQLESRVRERTADLESANARLRTEVAERERVERALQEVADGISAETGEPFFRSIVEHLAHTLGADYACISQTAPLRPTAASTLAVFAHGAIVPNFTYELDNSPCEVVLSSGFCIHPEHVCQRFPHDQLLKEMHVESYAGIPLVDSSGEVIGLLVVMHGKPLADTRTAASLLKIFSARAAAELERRKTDQELRESDQKFRQLAENIGEVFWMTTTDFRNIIYVSPAYEEIWGRKRQSLYDSPRRWVDAIHPDDRPRVLHALKAKSRCEFAEEYRIVRPDGSIRWIRDRAFPVRDQSGHIYRIAGIAEDFTDRKRAEEALRDQNLALANAMPGISRLDTNGRYVQVNEIYAKMMGYVPDELIGSDWTPTVHPQDRPRALEAYERMLGEGKGEFEARGVRKDGTVFYKHVMMVKMTDEQGTLVGHHCFMRDITERKQAEEQARRRQAELAHALRVSTMGEMAAGLAHELNQPLAAIVNYTSGCLRRLDRPGSDPKAIRDAMQRAADQAHRAGHILRRMRGFVRKHETATVPVDANILAREVLEFAATKIKLSDIQVRLELEDPAPFIRADSIQIEQVLLNLVRNALEAMKKVPPARRELTITTSRMGADQVAIAVADTGPGLPADLAQKVFDPFFTSKPEGLGMGLPISSSIIEAHGGRLEIVSNSDRGVTFRFLLPSAGTSCSPPQRSAAGS